MDEHIAVPDQVVGGVSRRDGLGGARLKAYSLAQLRLLRGGLRQRLVRQLDVTGDRIDAVDAEAEARGKLERMAPPSAPEIEHRRLRGQRETFDHVVELVRPARVQADVQGRLKRLLD